MAQLWGMTGKKHTFETRKKMSLKAIGNQNAKGVVISDKHKSILSKLKMGENNPNWKGGIYLTNNTLRRSPQYKRWQKSIYKRDNYECQICGIKGVNLRANHIKKFSDYPDLRFISNNGITICQNCDLTLVLNRESQWESYFNFNLMARGVN